MSLKMPTKSRAQRPNCSSGSLRAREWVKYKWALALEAERGALGGSRLSESSGLLGKLEESHGIGILGLPVHTVSSAKRIFAEK